MAILFGSDHEPEFNKSTYKSVFQVHVVSWHVNCMSCYPIPRHTKSLRTVARDSISRSEEGFISRGHQMDKSMLTGLAIGLFTATAGGSIAGFNRGTAMVGRLLKNLVHEVPDELSVCEFDCPYTECTVKDWVECDLRHDPMLRAGGIAPSPAYAVSNEAPVFPGSNLEPVEVN
jgi:hypothetical protein